MLFKRRGYQEECLRALAMARRQGKKRALVVMATGLGKTFTAACDVKRLQKKNKGRVLYLCHQNDILAQARKTFQAVLGEEYTFGYFHGYEKKCYGVDCVFASFQTMNNYRNMFDPEEFAYIVVDEGHHGPARTYLPTVNHFKPKFLLGLTATPERTDLQNIRKIYGEEVFTLDLEEALVRGLLTPVDYRMVTDDLFGRNLERSIETPVGKLNIRGINRNLFIPKRDGEIVSIIHEHMDKIPNPRVIIFCPSIKYCDRLALHLRGALPIHSGLTTHDQHERLSEFRRGNTSIALTVDKFNEGIDIPEANMIVFLRSTGSRTIFFQQLGRGLRQTYDKEKVLVLDFVGNCERLEMVGKFLLTIEEKARKQRCKKNKKNTININIAGITFSEQAANIIELLASVRTGYTQEILIRQLQTLQQKLGHSPSQPEISHASKQGIIASTKTFRNFFGSVNKAKQAAGLEISTDRSKATPRTQRRLKQTKKKLATELFLLARKLARAPITTDVEKDYRAGRGSPLHHFVQQFGSWSAALKAAGLSSVRDYHWTKTKVIRELRRIRKKLNKIPKRKDVEELGKIERRQTCVDATRKLFGSFSEARRAANLKK